MRDDAPPRFTSRAGGLFLGEESQLGCLGHLDLRLGFVGFENPSHFHALAFVFFEIADGFVGGWKNRCYESVLAVGGEIKEADFVGVAFAYGDHFAPHYGFLSDGCKKFLRLSGVDGRRFACECGVADSQH